MEHQIKPWSIYAVEVTMIHSTINMDSELEKQNE